MARKPTGRPRGRPKGAQQYPGDNALYVKMAELLHITRQAASVRDAARQVAVGADGNNTPLESKARRLARGYLKKEDWALHRAKARHAAGNTRYSSLADIQAAAINSLQPAREQYRQMQLLQRQLQPLFEEHERITKTIRDLGAI